MDWTAQQLEAITSRGKNILVAAAAGSGKTAVLVERIKRLILEDHCAIDRMLIVTFTNAAAAEMREKISRAVHGAAEEADEADVAFLQEQLNLLPQANISTFHAFALEIIRRYFYVIDVEPHFSICDEAQQTILRGEAMDELLEEEFEAARPEFHRFLGAYSGDRNEDRLREMLDKVYDTMQSLPEPVQWLHEKVEALRAGDLSVFAPVWEIAAQTLEAAIGTLRLNQAMCAAAGLSVAAGTAERDIAAVEALRKVLDETAAEEATDRRTALQQALSAFKLETMKRNAFSGTGVTCGDGKAPLSPEALEQDKQQFMARRNEVKEQIRALKKNFFRQDEDSLRQELQATAADGEELERLILRYTALYQQKKQEKGLLDFGDIEHDAWQILKDEEVCRFYREKFVHIFVDEYQDSNVIQEAFIGRICRPDNLFLVGDVKQSIYKFRLAEPEIFQRRYSRYAAGADPLAQKIDLNRNFRSKKPIIDLVNRVFGQIMEGYDAQAALYLGDPDGEKLPEEPLLCLTSTPWEEDEALDDEIRQIRKAEKEALTATAVIKNYLGKPFFDSKAGCARPLGLRDMVILLRGIRGYGDIFYHTLMENGIPAFVDDNDGYLDTMEINAMLSLLTVIDNEKQDVPLLTVLRAEFFDFSVEELAAVRIGYKSGSYEEAFSACARRAEAEKEEEKEAESFDMTAVKTFTAVDAAALCRKCAAALQKLHEWQRLATFVPLEELIWNLMLETGFYLTMGAMPGGRQRQANLRALVDRALNWRKKQGGSLYGFVRYMDILKTRKVASGQVRLVGEKDELVRIMTIHKSKGLEFPFVLLAGYCRKLNYTTMGKSLVIHQDAGLGFPLVNRKRNCYRTTTLQNLIREKFRQEEIAEEKRVLYVALTRPRDRLVMLGIADDARTAADEVLTAAPKDTSYFTMTGRLLCGAQENLRLVEDGDLWQVMKAGRRQSRRALDILWEGEEKDNREQGTAVDCRLAAQVDRQLRYRYADGGELSMKSKYAVSALNAWKNAQGERGHGEAEKPTDDQRSKSLAEPISFKAGEVFTAAQRGTIYHCLLEHLDFAAARAGGEVFVRETMAQLVREKFLTEEEAAVINPTCIARIAATDLGRRIAESKMVRREQPFNLQLTGGPAEIPDAVREGSRIIVQGVIDLYFAEEDGLVLVDYKTGSVGRRAEAAGMEAEKQRIADRYRTQITLYRQALEAAENKPVKEACICLVDCGEVVKM